MTADTLLHSMLRDLWDDLQDPSVFWQLGVLALCLAFAWWRANATLRRMLRQAADVPGVAAATPSGETAAAAATARSPLGLLRSQAAQQALSRVLFPIYALVLVLVARPILGIWQSTNLLRLAVALLAAFALIRVIVYVISRLAQTPALVAFERLLVVLVWISAALYITGYWVDVVELLEAFSVPVGKERISVWTIFASSFWVLLTLLTALWFGGFLEARLLASESLDASLRAVLGRLLRAVLLVIAVLVGLSLVGLDLTALSVFGGALGVGIGLGLQKIASNYVSGFIVLLERKVRLGDMVRVDQLSGRVSEIRTRFTVLRALDGVEHIVPNELLTGVAVQNFSASGALRLKVAVQVAYETDVARAREVSAQATLQVPRVLKDPPPIAMLTGFAADGLNLEVSFSIADPQMGQGNVQSDVCLALWEAFRREGISVPFPQREVRILKGPVNG